MAPRKPAKRAAKKAPVRRAARKTASPADAPELVQRLATPVDITPLNRKKPDYREIDVRAMTPGTYGGKRRKQGDVFRMGLTGLGNLPSWVEAQ